MLCIGEEESETKLVVIKLNDCAVPILGLLLNLLYPENPMQYDQAMRDNVVLFELLLCMYTVVEHLLSHMRILTIKQATVHSGANVIGLGDRDVVDVSGKIDGTARVRRSHIRTHDGTISQCHHHIHIPRVHHSFCLFSILYTQ